MNIDQIVYCWSPLSLLGTRGVGPIATSLPADGLGEWNERLGQAIWAADDAPGGPPGLAYLRFDGGAAVLHKLPVADASGRPGATFTHVLVSPGIELTADRALSLADWDGWYHDEDALPASRELKQLVLAELPRSRPQPDQDAFAQAVPMVSRILASPDQQFGVVEPTVAPTELLQVVLDVIGEIHGPWTFATRESTVNGVADARLLFLIRDPGFSAHSGRRVEIRQEDPADGRYADFARTLVDVYRRGGVDVMSRVRGLCVGGDISGWAKAALLAPGVVADHWWLLTSAYTGAISPPEQDFLGSQRGLRFIAEALGKSGDAEIVELLSAAEREPAAPSRAPADSAVLEEALRRCLGGEWPAAELLTAVRRAQPAQRRVSATLASGLPGGAGSGSRQERLRRQMTAIAVALTLCPGLLRADDSVRRVVARVSAADLLEWARVDKQMRGSLIRMVADTAADRRRLDAAVRTQLEAGRYFGESVVAEYGPHEAVTAVGDLLELGYGVGIAGTPDEASTILRRLGDADADLYHIVLMALGLRVRAADVRSLVEHMVALREFRRYQPDFKPPVGSVRTPPIAPTPQNQTSAAAGLPRRRPRLRSPPRRHDTVRPTAPQGGAGMSTWTGGWRRQRCF